jgi:CheY-like chemotaxis protein
VPEERGEARGVYSIGAVARMLGVPVARIRNWEERYGRIVPERSAGGHRLYSPEQVEQLRVVAAHVSDGLSAADAHRLLAASGRDEQRPATGATTGRPHAVVLVAERDPVGADLERFFLRREGYEVRVALTAGEAQERWLESRPDLVIVELMISGGRGADLCRGFKRRAGGPVLAVSVLDARDEALAAGADAFLRKPFDPAELVSTASHLLAAGAASAGGAVEAS